MAARLSPACVAPDLPRPGALAFAVRIGSEREARLGQGDAAPELKRCAPASPLVQ
jgi:hypothetical protein